MSSSTSGSLAEGGAPTRASSPSRANGTARMTIIAARVSWSS